MIYAALSACAVAVLTLALISGVVGPIVALIPLVLAVGLAGAAMSREV